MSGSTKQLAESVDRIAEFAGKHLATKIGELEYEFSRLDRVKVKSQLQSFSINKELLAAALSIKRSAAQIDVVLHALGILVRLPSIMEDSEIVESLSRCREFGNEAF